MGPRTAILGGLLAGVVAGAALLAALIALLPAPVPQATSPGAVSPGAASPSVAASASPSVPPSAPPSAVLPPTAVPSLLPTAAADGAAAFHVGERAPALSVPLLGGGSIELADLRGRPVWLVFMATWCPTCLDELPQMGSFAARYEGEGLVVAAIDVGEPEDVVAECMDRLGVLFPVGLDQDGRAADQWGVLVPPIHFFIDAEGVVREGALGGIGRDVMAASLRTIMPGVDVVP